MGSTGLLIKDKLVFICMGIVHVFIKSATQHNMGELSFFFIHIGPTMHLNIIVPFINLFLKNIVIPHRSEFYFVFS